MTVTNEIQMIADTIRSAVPAEKIYLFGSYAYGTPNANSDYDFYVIIPEGVMRPIEAMQKSYRALYSLKNIPDVDIVANTQNKFDLMRGRINTIEQDVAQKGVVLFERHDMGA
jgi:predicted nucleotidyltransferase